MARSGDLRLHSSTSRPLLHLRLPLTVASRRCSSSKRGKQALANEREACRRDKQAFLMSTRLAMARQHTLEAT